MPSTTPLNNTNLNEAMLPAASYNALPLIVDAKLTPLEHRAAHGALLNLINANNLSDLFSIHLVHKHFDCPDGQVMVYEPVEGGKTSDFIIMTPRDPAAVKGLLRGLYFMATPDGKMTAYEYTNLPGQDLSAHEDFAAQFAAAAADLGVAGIFCLAAEGVATGDYMQAEFEMPALRSTVVVHADELPDLREYDSVGTDWAPVPTETEDVIAGTGKAGDTVYPEVPGIITLHCIQTRSGKHAYHGDGGGKGSGKQPTRRPEDGEGTIETRQSIVGMSTGRGEEEVTIDPSVWIAGQSVTRGSVIHDILGRAVAAINRVEVC